MDLEKKLELVPDQPGVYLMKDKFNKIIYVGKAVNLKNRLRSYFRTRNHPPKVGAMLKKLQDFEYIVTNSEIEALALECNFIKNHQPRYNILLRDDKQYPYLKLTTNEDFPRLVVTRQIKNDGARYFGPYTDVGALNETLHLLKRIFPLRTCSNYNFNRRKRPCLNFYINRCRGPCQDAIKPEEYGEMVQELVLFLEGQQNIILDRLNKRMAEAAEQLNFEQAAKLRDQITAVKRMLERQTVVSLQGEDQDVIALAAGSSKTCIQVFQVRAGKMLARETFFLTDSQGYERSYLLSAFLKDYYARAAIVPPLIILAEKADEQELIASYLSQKSGRRVKLHVPQRGTKKALVRLAAENAVLALQEAEELQKRRTELSREALADLQVVLDLPAAPRRIEGFDISNIRGQHAVGSMAVFVDGQPFKAHYRRFRIRTVFESDDYAMLAEMVKRRYGGSLRSCLLLPELILIDGGQGQLSAASRVLKELGLGQIPVCALAEQQEELYKEGQDPIRLPDDSAALHLLQQVRDEAHRFALDYHRLLRQRSTLKSELDEVPGIGPKRRRLLLSHFGSVKNLQAAPLKDLLAIPGLPRPVAEALYQHFHPEEDQP